jgi:hypothetical protein
MIQNLTPTRHYNSLIDKGDYFIKSSVDIDKIAAEIRYYENLPKPLESFYPKYLGRTDRGKWPAGYKIEKIPENDISLFFINKIQDKNNYCSDLFNLITNYLSIVPKRRVTTEEFKNALNTQILRRDIKRVNSLTFTPLFKDVLNIFKTRGYEDVNNFLTKLHHKIKKEVSTTLHLETWYTHGDLCFF